MKLAAFVIIALAAIAQESRTVWSGVYTNEQAKRGEKLYGQRCASCHGDLLTGGETAPPLAGGEFLANWTGLPLSDLFDRMRKTMPADKPRSLSNEANADILAHILSVNRFPAGSAELPPNAEMLKQIRIEANKKE